MYRRGVRADDGRLNGEGGGIVTVCSFESSLGSGAVLGSSGALGGSGAVLVGSDVGSCLM